MSAISLSSGTHSTRPGPWQRCKFSVANQLVRMKTFGTRGPDRLDRLIRVSIAYRWLLVREVAARQFMHKAMLCPGRAEPQVPTDLKLSNETTTLLLEHGARLIVNGPSPTVSLVLAGAMCALGERALPFFQGMLPELRKVACIAGTRRAQILPLVITHLRALQPHGPLLLRKLNIEEEQRAS